MHLWKGIGLAFFVSGLICYYTPVTNWLTLHFGNSVGRFSGIVFSVVGWAIIGATLAFCAGIRYQQSRTKSSQRSLLVNERK